MLASYDLTTIAARLARVSPPSSRSAAEGRAAVAAVLRARPGVDGEAELLLVRRATHPRDPWSGHMAFPGGRREASDRDLLATAIRETHEEVGLDLEAHGDLVAAMPLVPTFRNELVVAPFVFALRGPADAASPLSPNEEEVAEAIWAPLAPIARGEHSGVLSYVHEGTPLELPCFRIEERVVWGLTHRMLSMLLEALHA